MKTQDIINNLHKIQVSQEYKQIIENACEKLAHLQNKLNNLIKLLGII